MRPWIEIAPGMRLVDGTVLRAVAALERGGKMGRLESLIVLRRVTTGAVEAAWAPGAG